MIGMRNQERKDTMKKVSIVILLAFSIRLSAQSQSGDSQGNVPASGQATFVLPGEGLPASSPGDRPHDGHNRSFATSSMLSSLGIGQNFQYQIAQSSRSAMQFRSGATVFPGGTRSNIAGQSVMATVVPMFAGARYDWSVTRTRMFEWRQYSVVGAGPVMGVEFPESYGFWQTLGKLGFRWGAGMYAGIGSELHFSEGVTVVAQLELDGIGFLSPLLNRKTFLGPSFSIGFDFAP